jgi:hypothetical protein
MSFTPPTGPGRCRECGWHTSTQGHQPTCESGRAQAAAATDVRAERYRASLCIDCGVVPYSAGRPRCNACHATWWAEQGRGMNFIDDVCHCRPGGDPPGHLCAHCQDHRHPSAERGTTMSDTDIDLSRDEVIKTIRAALRRRSGKSWSVRGGKGTGWGWIDIGSPAARCDEHGLMTDEEMAELSELLGVEVHGHGVGFTDWEQYIDRAEGRTPKDANR